VDGVLRRAWLARGACTCMVHATAVGAGWVVFCVGRGDCGGIGEDRCMAWRSEGGLGWPRRTWAAGTLPPLHRRFVVLREARFGPCCCLGAEGPWELVVLCCCARCGGDLGEAGVEELPHCGVCYLSPWQRVRRWVRRGPHAEWPGSVGVPNGVVGVCAEASLAQGVGARVFAV
jgi:hypothetical protein